MGNLIQTGSCKCNVQFNSKFKSLIDYSFDTCHEDARCDGHSYIIQNVNIFACEKINLIVNKILHCNKYWLDFLNEINNRERLNTCGQWLVIVARPWEISGLLV